MLLSGHVHGRWQQRFVRLSMTWFEIVGTASWTKPFFVSAELDLVSDANKQLIMRIKSVSALNCHPNHSTPKSWYFWCKLVTYMGVDSNCSFVYPWLDLRLSALLHEQNPFFVAVELELGFWCKQTAHYFPPHAIWCRNCFELKTLFSFLLELSCFEKKTNSSLWGFRFLFLNCHPNHSNPSHDIWCVVSGHVHTALTSNCSFCLSMTWFGDCRNCFMNKNPFFVSTLNWRS